MVALRTMRTRQASHISLDCEHVYPGGRRFRWIIHNSRRSQKEGDFLNVSLFLDDVIVSRRTMEKLRGRNVTRMPFLVFSMGRSVASLTKMSPVTKIFNNNPRCPPTPFVRRPCEEKNCKMGETSSKTVTTRLEEGFSSDSPKNSLLELRGWNFQMCLLKNSKCTAFFSSTFTKKIALSRKI